MASRRGHGEGSISQRKSDGLWTARVDLGIVNGKCKRKQIYGKTRKEVADKLTEKLTNKDVEITRPVQSGMTVREFFAEYEEAIRHTIKRRSYQTSRDVIRLHLLPEFGAMRLTDLDRKRIQRVYTRKRDAGLSRHRQ